MTIQPIDTPQGPRWALFKRGQEYTRKQSGGGFSVRLRYRFVTREEAEAALEKLRGKR